jgi:uncharacterized protein (DUF2147 family)
MKTKFILFATILFSITCNSQSIIGNWKTIDDETKKPKSVVEIYEKSGIYYGKVVEIFDKARAKENCTNCTGAEKDKPILGMVILKGLKKDGTEYNSGKILDPKNGTLYKCKITPNGNDKIEVRGYIGISLLGRTQTWIRQ